MYTVAELFCGCGGFSQGFFRSNRFNVVLGNDIKQAALRTYVFNHTTEESGVPEILTGDIRLTRTRDIVAALARKGIFQGELDCLIGGPPCQGFSQMRRSEEREYNEIVHFKGYNRLDEDPRNDLVLRFLEIADILQPKFILIENVPQMKHHSHNGVLGGLADNVKALLNQMGYNVIDRILNAANYGVPQLRERLFFLASRVCSVSFPEETHTDTESLSSRRLDTLLFNRKPWITVFEAIADLPYPASGPEEELGGQPLELYPQVPLSEYAYHMRSQTSFPYNHLTRSYRAKIIGLIREMQPGETWDHATRRMQERYEQLLTQQRSSEETREETLARLVNQGVIEPTFYRDYYWSAYTRLAWDRPALTITANANFLGSGRFTHPEQHRGITMREAARLQSFNDDFRFITAPDNDHETNKIGIGLDMIGEAVPPLLAEAIAQHIASLLDTVNNQPTTEATVEIMLR